MTNEAELTSAYVPRPEQVVQRFDRLGASRIMVLFDYHFIGGLVKRIKQHVEQLAEQLILACAEGCYRDR